MMQPPLETIGQQLQARSNIADHFALRKVDPLHVGRRVADVDDLRTFGAHDEGRLFDGVVTYGNNQIGSVDRFMNVIALAECSRPHVEVAAAGYRSLPICVVKNGIFVRRTKPPMPAVLRGRDAAAPSMIKGRLALRIMSAARSSEARWATGISIGCGATIATSSDSSPAMSSGSSEEPDPDALPWRSGRHRERLSECRLC